MKNSDLIKKGLERAYWKLIAFKKYKKSPMIVEKNGQIIEIPPQDLPTQHTNRYGVSLKNGLVNENE